MAPTPTLDYAQPRTKSRAPDELRPPGWMAYSVAILFGTIFVSLICFMIFTWFWPTT
jgi:hypothetical protein